MNVKRYLVRILVLVLSLAFFWSSANAESSLPPCLGEYNETTWTDCVGTYTNADGQKYVGEWKDDKRHGQGTITFPDGGGYVGEFRDGLPNGQGTYTFADGTKYVGMHKDDRRHGQGTLTLASGDKYVGEWKDDKRHGQGTTTYANGEKYVGEWKDDKKNGQGTYTFASGSQHVGEWKDGKPVVPPTTTYAAESIYDAEPTYRSGSTSTFGFPPWLTDLLPSLIVIGGIFLLLFLALREVFCWYWKINERIRLEKQIIVLLMKQNAKTHTD